ncbi:hypothetical protein Hanom_Chr05g00407861 [Helianthus anomalus]
MKLLTLNKNWLKKKYWLINFKFIASSYVQEHIFNITPNGKESEKNKKGIRLEYHQVPPPLEDNYTFYDCKNVEKVINMVEQLLDNIDVTYTKFDDLGDLVGKVVESILLEEYTKTDKSESRDENEGSFHERYN